ncbi:MAG: hypothetical protein ACRDNM_09000, partial [Gaiellaceae bacterium]
NFLSADAHQLLKQQIHDRLDHAEPGHGIKGDVLRDTVVGELAGSPYMLEFSNRLLGDVDGARAYISEPIRSEEIVPGINLMRATRDVTPYHFDGTYLNVILAVEIPKLTGPRRGQLVIYPNIRSFKGRIWGPYVAPLATRSGAMRRLLAAHRREIDYEEGGAYLFYGYRSLHGVEAQSADAFRAITNMTVGATRFAAGRP